MTIPRSSTLPKQRSFETTEEVNKYVGDLVKKLEDQYEEVAQAINGQIKSSYQVQQENWTPIIKGTTIAGSPTYVNQTGMVLRQGLLVDVWADVQWSSAGGAAGVLYVELPYRVATADNYPFCGCAQTSNIAFAAGVTTIGTQAIQGTYRCEFWCSGSGAAIVSLAVPASGKIMFHIRYMGVQDER